MTIFGSSDQYAVWRDHEQLMSSAPPAPNSLFCRTRKLGSISKVPSILNLISLLIDLVTLGLVLILELKKLKKTIPREGFYYFLGTLRHIISPLMATVIGSYNDIHLTWFLIASNKQSNHNQNLKWIEQARERMTTNYKENFSVVYIGNLFSRRWRGFGSKYSMPRKCDIWSMKVWRFPPALFTVKQCVLHSYTMTMEFSGRA